MAKLELPKGIKSPKSTPALPNKQTMNFVHHESSFNMAKVLPLAVVLVAISLVLVNVGIMEPLNQKAIAYNDLAARQDQLAVINAQLAGYDELAAQYGRYSYGWMNDYEVNMVSRMDVLDLVEAKVAPVAVVDNMSVNNNILTLNIHGITLENASAMVKDLETSPLVARASLLSAVAEEAQEARISLSITLQKEVAE